MGVIFSFLGEAIRKAGKAAHAHAHREILPLRNH
jgi:hypothetical protein